MLASYSLPKAVKKDTASTCIEVAKVKDADKVLPFYVDLLRENLPYLLSNPEPSLEQEKAFIEFGTMGRNTVLLAKLDKEVIGMLTLFARPQEQFSHRGSIFVSVKNEYRNKGIGTKLMEEVIAWAKVKNYTRLELEVAHNNPALNLYERLGFQHEGTLKHAMLVGNEFHDVHLMNYPLNA